MSKSDVVISQAGYGSCLDALKLGCTLVLVPRIQELAECLDDQQELADHISDHGQAQSVSTYFELRAAVYLGLETSNSEIRNDVQYGQAVANSILEHLNLKSVLE